MSTPANSPEPISQTLPNPIATAPVVCESQICPIIAAAPVVCNAQINEVLPQNSNLNSTPATQINCPTINSPESNVQPNSADLNLIVQQDSIPSILPKSHLSLKLVKDSIPKFDGKSNSLINFIKQCKLLDSKIKPEDRRDLLFLIQNQIEGHAKIVLSNSKEPETLDELFILLKNSYIRSFNIQKLNAQLMQLRQGINEPVDEFGNRVNEILSGGLETAKDIYNSERFEGVSDFLKSTAIFSFVNGISNDTIRFYLNRKNDANKLTSLESTIAIASNLNAEHVEHLNSKSSFIQSAKIFKTDIADHETPETRTCFKCHQIGHLSRQCRSFEKNQVGFRNHERIRCGFCKKSGHTENNCFKKQNLGTFRALSENSRSGDLNLKATPQKGTTRSEALIASAKPNELATKST